MAFLTQGDYDDLPDDDEEAFAYLVSISEERAGRREGDNNGNMTWSTIGDYMNEVAAIAEQFDVSGINFSPPTDDYHGEYARFKWTVQARLAQIRVRKARRDRRTSVSLPAATRQRVQNLLEQLKSEVLASSLSEKRRRALLDRIGDLEAELAGKKRVNLAVVMAVVALVVQTVHESGDILLNANKYVAAITRAVGKEQAGEADELLPPPPKRIEHKPHANQHAPSPPLGSADDNDVPF